MEIIVEFHFVLKELILKIKLNCGREIVLDTIHQFRTYAGLYAGVPNSRLNERYIKSAMEYADEILNSNRCYLVPPKFLEVENIDKRIKRYNDAIRLPYITSIVQFESSVLKDDDENDGSFLSVVWYQDDFAMPIDKGVLEQIKLIDWEREAEGFEF